MDAVNLDHTYDVVVVGTGGRRRSPPRMGALDEGLTRAHGREHR